MDTQKFKALCLDMFSARRDYDEASKVKAEKHKRLERFKADIVDYMNELEIPNFDTGVGKIIRTNRTSAKCIDRHKFHEYLKARGLYDDLTSVNSNTLSSFYKEELKKAVKTGDMNFHVPGVESTIAESISIRGMK